MFKRAVCMFVVAFCKLFLTNAEDFSMSQKVNKRYAWFHTKSRESDKVKPLQTNGDMFYRHTSMLPYCISSTISLETLYSLKQKKVPL